MTSPHLVTGQQAVDANRASIVMALVQRGPLSRAELARLSGVTRTTIGSYVEGLLADGVVEELPAASNGAKGRPARPVWLCADAGLSGTVVVQHGGVEAALVNARGEAVTSASADLPSRRDAHALVDVVAELLDQVGALDQGRVGSCVVVPTAVDFDRQQVQASAQVPAIDATRFVPALHAALDGHPVVVENDARAGVLAELWWGRGRHVPAFWSVQVGEGIGAAAIGQDDLRLGRRGTVGEIGHTTVGGDRPCGCGRRGCWETTASLRWLRDEARRRGLRGARTLDAGRLAARVADGDAAAEALLGDLSRHLAVGLANLVHTVGPPVVVLQGEIVAGGELLRAEVERAVRAATLDHLRDAVEIHLSDLGDRTRILGGAAVVLATRGVSAAP